VHSLAVLHVQIAAQAESVVAILVLKRLFELLFFEEIDDAEVDAERL